MKRLIFTLFFGLTIFYSNAQFKKLDASRSSRSDLYQNDTTNTNGGVDVKIVGKTNYKDYKIISYKNDTTIIDTTLTIEKNYKLNYLRKDMFEYISFNNQGQTYNKLGFDFRDNTLFPSIGFSAKQNHYFKISDINYYQVPTPTSELMARKGLQQGQVLDAFFTANTSKRFNFSVAYRGLRSLGKYQHALSSHGNFRATTNYITENTRYLLRAHYYSFDFYNEQNGGLTEESILNFEDNNPDFTKRNRLDVNYIDADNIFEGKRYYLDHSYTFLSNRIPKKEKKKSTTKPPNSKGLKDSLKGRDGLAKSDSIQLPKKKKDSIGGNLKPLIGKKRDSISGELVAKIGKTRDSVGGDLKGLIGKTKDSISNTKAAGVKNDSISNKKQNKALWELLVGNSLMYETKHHRFEQSSANSVIGDAFSSSISDHTSYQNFKGELFLQMNSDYLGRLKIKTNYFNYNYHYNRILFFDDSSITNNIKGNSLSIGADWTKKFGNIRLNGDASTTVVGNLNGNSLKASASYKKDSIFDFEGYAQFTSRAPNFNKQLFQSDYKEYNWQNDFSNEEMSNIGFLFSSEKWANIDANFSVIDNYTYFDENSTPIQASETVNYLKVKLQNSISYGKFTLDNTVMYQNVSKGDSFFHVPTWTTRNTIYFSTDMFKGDPLFLQTGITFKYFTKFNMNAYDPVLSEFINQNSTEIGDFPVFDIFVNFRIQRTRFYFKYENASGKFTGYNYYSAPGYPYRDSILRFGLVWNFFI